MNCDQVFESLTRGPFPSGSSDDKYVERHLAVCHDCRCLAEALRPAVALFHESLETELSEALPQFQGNIPSVESLVPKSASPMGNTTNSYHSSASSTRMAKQDPHLRNAISACNRQWMVWGAVATVLILSALVLVFHQTKLGSRATPIAVNNANMGIEGDFPRHSLGELETMLSALIELPDSCRSFLRREHFRLMSSESNGIKTLSTARELCCTHCHGVSRQRGLSSQGVVRLASSCGVCHSDATHRTRPTDFLTDDRKGA